ncbi:1-acyl-sn-glycerol-3-phosphate acyltransferase [Abditibacteriota bacterium]|nr:1-acyl-sn-glycerol-3-phosphate acyltransferase [Abditibacteriota bacterium]
MSEKPTEAPPREIVPRHTWVFPFMSLVFKGYLSIAGWHVKGRENVPATGAVILAPNHVSLLDPPLVGVSCGRWPFIMAKAELFHGIVGWAIEQMGSFPVRRGGADRKAFKQARKSLEAGHPLLIFPEGTRSRTGALGKAEPGLLMIAHAAKCPIVPVYIRGTERAFSPRRPGFRLVRARITFGKPIDFSQEYTQKGGRELFEAMGERLMHEIEALK